MSKGSDQGSKPKTRRKRGTEYRPPADIVSIAVRYATSLWAGKGDGPTFMIVGAMKAGTSTLHATLAQHPEIFMTDQKEIHAWDKEHPPSLASYHMHFDAGRGLKVRGESTPSYAYQPGTMPKLARYNPRLKLVFIMRDPVLRAISHLNHSMTKRKKLGTPPFDELREDLRDMSRHDVSAFRHSPFGYHARGLYHVQIARMRKFFPEDRIFLMRLEDFKAAPQQELDRLCDFLAVERHALPVQNRGVKRYSPPSQELIDYLSAYYRLPNEVLAADFGVRTDDWL